MRVAALFVEAGGVYFGFDGVDPWDAKRDARGYAGPWPVVAHPPCERWGRYWGGAPTTWPRLKLGDDGGCFAAALAAVRLYGGVLEHPEGSHAWRAFGLNLPPHDGGWVNADFEGGWTCCVDQGHYGHRASKSTWLYACGVDLPSLTWGRAGRRLPLTGLSDEQRRRAIKTGICQRLSKKQRAATSVEFRDLLIEMARSAQSPSQPTAESGAAQHTSGAQSDPSCQAPAPAHFASEPRTEPCRPLAAVPASRRPDPAVVADARDDCSGTVADMPADPVAAAKVMLGDEGPADSGGRLKRNNVDRALRNGRAPHVVREVRVRNAAESDVEHLTSPLSDNPDIGRGVLVVKREYAA